MSENMTPEEERIFAKHARWVDAVSKHVEAGGSLDGPDFAQLINDCKANGIDVEGAIKDLMPLAIEDDLGSNPTRQ